MVYDTIVIGSGPAGLTASIYASRYKLSNLVIGKLLGGTITHAYKVENFPGFISISGIELANKIVEQVKNLGTEILPEGVKEIVKNPPNEFYKIKTESGKEFEVKTVIIAAGSERRKLGIPGEKEYLGKGVSYCATCDAAFFRGKTVVLVGGSNAACSSAVHLAEFAKKLYLVYRKSELRAEPVWVEEVKSIPKIQVIYATNLTEILGDGNRVTRVKLDVPFGNSNNLVTDGVFVEIGGVPVTDFTKSLGVEKDESGYIKVTPKMETNLPGVFAAGDITDQNLVLQQALTACSQGAIAAYSAFVYLKSKKAS